MAVLSPSTPTGIVGGQQFTFATTGDWTDPTDTSDGLAGGVTFQITGISGDTLTPQITGDGTNYVTALVTDLSDGSTDTSITANGIFRVDLSGGLKFRLLGATIAATPVATIRPYTG